MPTSKPPASARGILVVVALVLLGFFLLTGVTAKTDCVIDGRCEFGIPLRWSDYNAFGTVLFFAFDLALFLSIVPAVRGVQGSRSRLAIAYLLLVGVLLAGFTAVNWSGKLGLRIAWHGLF